MVEIIQTLLNKLNIDQWKILEERTEARELFFIKQDLDMNRAKQIRKYIVTVYRDFKEGEDRYKGSASLKILPTMKEEEIRKELDKAYYAASFVKNPYYPLPGKGEQPFFRFSSRLASDEWTQILQGLTGSLYKNDTPNTPGRKGGINSAEIFVSRMEYRFINSGGIDVSYSASRGDIELITEWQEGEESVELYNMFSFSDYCPDLVEKECAEQIENCRLRALARKAPDLKGVNIILKGEAVGEMMDFYVHQASARAKYEGLSRAETGRLFQGDDVQGDVIDLTLNPALPNAPGSVPYDRDGITLKPVMLYEKGVLKQFHGDIQYSYYLGIKPTGSIPHREVKPGNGEAFRKYCEEPHVEVLAFSDFQMDSLTGDFGGEIRLARYFDGKEYKPITGASLSACLFDVQKEIYLSDRIIQKDFYKGPDAVLFRNAHIAGSGE